jgi:hypothetical protein
MARDVDPSTDPDAVVSQHVLNEPLQCGDPARPTDDPSMQADREHLRAPFFAFGPEHVERIAAVRFPLRSGGKSAG